MPNRDTLRAPAMLFSFWSIRLIGSQNYMAAAASLPLLGLGLEEIAARLNMLPGVQGSMQLWQAVLVILGCLLILAARAAADPDRDPVSR